MVGFGKRGFLAKVGGWLGGRLGGRSPTLQHVQANAAQLVDVGVEDLGQEADLWGDHGVVVGEEEFELEGAA